MTNDELIRRIKRYGDYERYIGKLKATLFPSRKVAELQRNADILFVTIIEAINQR